MDSLMKERAMKALYVFGIVLTVYVGILAIGKLREYSYIGSQYPSGNVITITGEGEVFAVPDIAEISFSVNEEAATLPEAQEAAAIKMNAAIEYLKAQGVDEKDIKTTNYSANPRYEYRNGGVTPMYDTSVMYEGETSTGSAEPMRAVSYPVWDGGDTRVLVGYDVYQTISVKIRDTDKAGELIAGVTAKGITDIYGPNFTIDDEDELQRDARHEAIEDAREKAEQLADDLDVRLVRIVSFNENGGGYYPMYAKMEMAMDSDGAAPVAPTLTPGENRISASVTITYEIR
ncbi:MAG: uncharacterized protein QG633_109 [Patescibacteria group bacterium]|nr:uncharacterized protein [Patescibacteria group bacterium]